MKGDYRETVQNYLHWCSTKSPWSKGVKRRKNRGKEIEEEERQHTVKPSEDKNERNSWFHVKQEKVEVNRIERDIR